jgi:predicted metalloprotease
MRHEHLTAAYSNNPLATTSGDAHEWRVNRIVVALMIAGSLFLPACLIFREGGGEEFQQESGRTVYRSVDQTPPGESIGGRKKEKVPGE